MKEPSTRAGYVALMGRPNVGKSTLLNRLLARKVSITASKPQTTRHALLGIQTLPDSQIVYVDTPGFHERHRRALDRYLNRAASGALGYVDLVVFLVEAGRWLPEDDNVLKKIRHFPGEVLLVVNKVDRISDKKVLLPFMKSVSEKHSFATIIPLSALKDHDASVLEGEIIQRLPQSEFLFPEDQLTTVGPRFEAAELVREQLIRMLHNELPYALTVEIEQFQDKPGLLSIGAVIWVERDGQKGIVVGNQGSKLKQIGTQARQALESRFGKKVFLQTWVKVRQGWSDDERALRAFGYQDET